MELFINSDRSAVVGKKVRQHFTDPKNLEVSLFFPTLAV